MDIFNDKFRLSVAVFRGYGFAFAMHGHGDSCRILPGFHGYGSAVFFQIHNGRHLDAGCAVPEQLKMLLGYRNQPDLPVQTAVEGEVRLLRIHAVAVLVADGDLQQVPVPQLSGQLRPEGGISALVVAKFFTVQKHFTGVCSAVQFQINAVSYRFFRRKFPRIPAGAPVIIVAAVLSVHIVPGVG